MITKGKSHCIDHVVSVGAVSVEEQSDLSLPKHSLNKSFVILIKTGMLFMTIFFCVSVYVRTCVFDWVVFLIQ